MNAATPPSEAVPPEKWHALDSCWRSIVGLEANVESLRLTMESLRGEMERAFNQSLGFDERLHASPADVAQWNSAKNRLHYALPKAREFTHRASLALTGAERKRLGELHQNHIAPRVPFPRMDQELEHLEHLLKDRQVLLAQGNAAQQECRSALAGVEGALSTLRRNAADNARRKASAERTKGGRH